MQLQLPTETDSPNRKIFRATLIVGLFTLVAKFGATVKELIVAQWFGRSDSVDAFLIAYLLPSVVMNVLAGALAPAIIPTFISTLQKEGAEAAQKLFSSMILVSLFILGPVAIVLGLLAPYYLPLLGANFSPAKLELTRNLLYVLLPFVLFAGIASSVAAVLNAFEKFALPAVAPFLTPLATILLIELGAQKWGAFSLAAGVVAGSVLEASLLLCALRPNGIRFALRWGGFDPGVRAVLGQYFPMVAGAFLAGGTLIVDQSMAAMLQPGSVAALNYANKTVGVVLALGAAALGTAVLPYFSKMIAANDWSGCRHTLKRYSLLVLVATVPFTACLIIFAKPLVRLLFQRGAFTAADTDLVSWIQVCYAIQIPFYIWVTLFVRFLSSVRRNDVLMYGAAISLLLDIVFNVVFMRILGIAGIALSSSLVYACLSLLLVAWTAMLLARQRFPLTEPAPGAGAIP